MLNHDKTKNGLSQIYKHTANDNDNTSISSIICSLRYSINARTITKECNNIRVYIIKIYIIIRKYNNIIKFFKHFIRSKRTKNKF